MKKMLVLSIALAALLFSACSSNPDIIPLGPAPEYQQQTDAYIIIDHKNNVISRDIPEWVTRYISGGVREVEAMPIYQNAYVFIGEDKGTNLQALKQWVSNFSVTQDLARMVSSRVQLRFTNAATGSPDEEYGRYFENVVKNVTDVSFSGARKETDFWLLKRYFQADGQTVEREEYEYFVLVTIDRSLLQRQIDDVLDRANAATQLSDEESAAVIRVKEVFYEGF
ncbi:MAG: hypothetical protein LBV20_06245 [Treponema sp.]|jgi:hypothetical protein|nr:hypothetical protein [Treponema sp.]